MSHLKSQPDWSRSRQPLYLQLAAIFRSRIENGLWPRGEQIPTIDTLMEEFGVGRVTVRKAFAELEEEGLLVSARGRGTFVRELPKNSLLRFDISTSWDELVARGNLNKAHDFKFLSKAPEALPQWCQAEGKIAPLYQGLERVYVRENIRVCYSRIYVESRLFEEIQPITNKQAIISVLGHHLEGVPKSGQQVITFISADENTAQKLKASIGTPIAQIIRQIYDEDDLLIYWSCVHYDARYLQLNFDLFAQR